MSFVEAAAPMIGGRLFFVNKIQDLRLMTLFE